MEKKRLLKRCGSERHFRRVRSVMRLCAVFCFLMAMDVPAKAYSQHDRVSLSLTGVTVESFIDAVRCQTGVSFMYRSGLFDHAGKVSVEVRREPLDRVLEKVLGRKGFVFDYADDAVVIRRGSETVAFPQQTEKKTVVSGTVKDVSGPLPGVNVVEKGTTNGIVTDVHGNFSFSVSPNAVLVFSFVGYHSKTIPLDGRKTLSVILEEESKGLEEVVIVGYGTQKKVNLTGAVSTVDVGKTLEARPQADVSKALQGVVPGLTIINSSGELNARPSMTIRGTGTLSNGAISNPLIVVDGVPMDDISYLNTQDIENISVLKDAASTSIYGARAAFGVILITTKSARKTGKTMINYTNNFSWDTPTMLPDYPDVATQARALREANTRAGIENELFGMYMNDDFIAKAEGWKQRHGGKAGYREMVPGDDFDLAEDGSALYYADWDVVGIMFRNWKPSQSHNISVQGTSGKTSYFLSAGYNHEEGVMTFNPDKMDKYNVSMNVTSDVKDWLQIGGRFSYSEKVYTRPNVRRSVYTYMWRWGSFFGPYGTYKGVDMRNDIAYLKQAGDDKTNFAFRKAPIRV